VADVDTATEVVIPYTPRSQQQAIHDALLTPTPGGITVVVAVCHRRMGKTVAGVNHPILAALDCPLERPQFGIIGPTYTQEKRNAWEYLKHYAMAVPGCKVNETELSVRFPEQNDSLVRIFGADRPASLRGLYLDGAVLDEFQDHPPNFLTEIIIPLMADRLKWLLILGTPNGRNQFYKAVQKCATERGWTLIEFKASQTGIVPPDVLDAARSVMTEDEYQQEFECSFEASVKGAIWAREMAAAWEEGRVTHVPYDPEYPVDTDWDLGVGDQTAIWFTQSRHTGDVHVIDYYESSGVGLDHYARVLQEKRYVYGTHWAPHDIEQREFTSGRTRLESARRLGINFAVVPRVKALEDRIHAARMIFPRCRFDAEKCREGLDALASYKRDYNTRIKEHVATPVHDWASHAADAFGGLAIRHYNPKAKPEAMARAALKAAQRDSDPFRWQPVRVGRGGY